MPSEQKTNSTIPSHSEPFGCTQDGCNEVFGSESDWKRHENSQHHQLECWKCNIHSHTPTPRADTANTCGNCFCRKVVKLCGKAGIEDRDKRFDHTAWHFDNLRVKDGWMRLEEPSPDYGQKVTGILGTKYREESSEGEDEEDVELINSLLKRRHTSSFSTQSESTLETGKLEGTWWYFQTPPHADMPTSPPTFVPPSHTLIEPRPHEGEEVLPVLAPLNAFPDPWSSELAHEFPSNVRQVALEEFLDGLEPLLDIPNTNA